MQIVRRRRKKSQERNKLGEPPNLKKEETSKIQYPAGVSGRVTNK